MEKITRSPPLAILLLLLITAGSFFFRLGALPLTGSDEPRYARIAEEMLAAGSWVTPLLEGKPWLEKPPLYYWITIPVLALTGPGETAARLGPALLGLAAVLSVYWIGRRLWGGAAGLYSGVILSTSLGFAGFARSASTDMPLAACLTIVMVLLMSLITDPTGGMGRVPAAYALLGTAILAKGPVALVLAGGILALFWWLEPQGGVFARIRPLRGLTIAAAVSVPWFWLAYRENGYSFLSVFFINHNLARYVSQIHHHAEPFYYYIPVLLGLMFPWSGWLGLLYGDNRFRFAPPRTDSARAALFLACWAGFPLLFFSLSESKLAGYILPSLPPIALLLGSRMAAIVQEPRALSKGAVGWYLGLSVAVSAGLPVLFQVRYGGRWLAGVVLGALVLVPGLIAVARAVQGSLGGAWKATVAQGLLLVVGATMAAFPVLADYHSTRGIAAATLEARKAEEPIVTYRFFHHTFSYYTGYKVHGQLKDRQSLEEFALAHPRFLLITEAQRLEEIRTLEGFRILELARRGKLLLLRVAHG